MSCPAIIRNIPYPIEPKIRRLYQNMKDETTWGVMLMP